MPNKDYSYYYEYEEQLEVPMIIGATVLLILLIVTFFTFDIIINGYFNPEYWSLDKILKSIKGC